MHENVEKRPLQAALALAKEAAEVAEASYDECECEPTDGEHCVHWHAMRYAWEAVNAARDELRESDEERDWILREGDDDYSTFEAASAEEALAKARSNVDRANYFDEGGTLWINIEVRCELTDEEASETVACEPDEPDCKRGSTAHDWQSPFEILGGIRENPGVWGRGGGVLIEEVCMICGCGRTTDTWAQDPASGMQGLTSVSYEVGKYTDEVVEMRAIPGTDEIRGEALSAK
jgi:hypothetical protein